MTSHFVVKIRGNVFEVKATAPTIKLGERGLIIGHLFSRRDLGRRVQRFGPEEIEQILKSGGKALISNYWGGYVAIVADDCGHISLIRDPSGTMPCFWRERDGEFLASNDIEDAACWGGPAEVKTRSLAQYLASPGYHGSETGLYDVHELIAGNALKMAYGEVTISSLWSPWDFAANPKQISMSQAAQRLKEVLDKCVGAWASCFENVVLGVSGGLDSSIIASAANLHTRLRCLSMYADDADGDERRYAKILTDHLGLKLQTGHFELENIDVARAILPHRPWPNASYFALGNQAKHQELAQHQPVGAFFTGNGGDNVFCSIRSASPFLDRLATEGPGLGLKRTLSDLCALTEADAGTVLKTAWHQYLNSRKPAQAKMDVTGFRHELAPTEALQHPWRSIPLGALPGKIAHVGFLAGAQQSHELYPRASHAPHIAPLLSQPIVELCLSIPTWYWIEGGMDRAVARRAFQSVLPELLLRRSSKGGPGGFVQDIYRSNAAAIKEIIRNGKLVRNGFVDLAYVNAADDPSWRGNSRAQRLLQFAAAENWINYWDGRTQSN